MTHEQRAQAYRRADEWQDAHAWQRQSAASKPETRDPGVGLDEHRHDDHDSDNERRSAFRPRSNSYCT